MADDLNNGMVILRDANSLEEIPDDNFGCAFGCGCIGCGSCDDADCGCNN